MSPSLGKVMKSIALLYANYGIDENCGDFLEVFKNSQRYNSINILNRCTINVMYCINSFYMLYNILAVTTKFVMNYFRSD